MERKTPRPPVACCRMGHGMVHCRSSYPPRRGDHSRGGTIFAMPLSRSHGSARSMYSSNGARMSAIVGRSTGTPP